MSEMNIPEGTPLFDTLPTREREKAQATINQAADMIASGWKPTADEIAEVDAMLIKDEPIAVRFRLSDTDREKINAGIRATLGGCNG